MAEKSKHNILPNAEITSLGLFFKKTKTLAIGDLHLGQEESFNNQGVLVPRINFTKVKKEIDQIFERTGKINNVVLLGDVKHEFSQASNQEWREVIELIELIQKHSKKVIVLRGNHDKYLKSIANWKKIELVDSFAEEKTLFCHGDKIIPESEKYANIVIGHEHAGIVLSDEYKREKFKCFAKTKNGKQNIIVMPSFNFMSIGTDIIREKLLSPYLRTAKEFEIWVIEEGQEFYFGKQKTTI